MRADERRITVIALAGGVLLALFVCFANFFVLYTLNLFGGGVPAGRYALITLGTALTGSPFYWFYRRYRRDTAKSREAVHERQPSAPRYTAPYTERDLGLVLEFAKQAGKISLEDVTALTGLNPVQAEALLDELETQERLPKQGRPAPQKSSPKNAQDENFFDGSE